MGHAATRDSVSEIKKDDYIKELAENADTECMQYVKQIRAGKEANTSLTVRIKQVCMAWADEPQALRQVRQAASKMKQTERSAFYVAQGDKLCPSIKDNESAASSAAFYLDRELSVYCSYVWKSKAEIAQDQKGRKENDDRQAANWCPEYFSQSVVWHWGWRKELCERYPQYASQSEQAKFQQTEPPVSNETTSALWK